MRNDGTDANRTQRPDGQSHSDNHARERAATGGGGRRAKVNRHADGSPLGVAVFLTGDDMAELGVDPDGVDAVEVQVVDGELQLTPLQLTAVDREGPAP